MTLLNPWWLLPASLLAVAGFALKSGYADDWQRVISSGVFNFLKQGIAKAAVLQPALLIAALGCAAISSPAIETTDSESYRHTQGWIVIADVSRSMTLSDTSPSRLSAMRNAALDLAARARANSTSLIIYAGDAFIAAPPSFDSENFKSNVALLEHGIIPLEGSNLTRAMSLAWSVIDGSQLVNARLFVLSDTGGFNNRSEAAIARLASHGHRTDVILFGSNDSDTAAPFDLEMAQSLAKSGNGQLLQADAIGQVELAELNLQSNLSDDHFLAAGLSSIRWHNQSHWLLLLAIPLMLWLFHREQQR
jgi:Ca-activated chloride channel family protein